MRTTDIDEVAALIQDSRKRGLPPPAELKGCLSLDQGYALQARLLEWFEQRGEVQAGWKIGGNSAQARTLFGTTEPFGGFILASGLRPSGASFPLASIPASPLLECEIAFHLARPLRGSGITREDVVLAVDRVYPALEVAGIGREAGLDPALNIADDIAHWAYVLGEPCPATGISSSPGEVIVTARRNNDVVFDHPIATAIDDQFESVAWLANHVARSGRELRAGDIIITGSCTPPTPVHAGDMWEVAFSGLGSVSASFA